MLTKTLAETTQSQPGNTMISTLSYPKQPQNVGTNKEADCSLVPSRPELWTHTLFVCSWLDWRLPIGSFGGIQEVGGGPIIERESPSWICIQNQSTTNAH